jgi:hypothetical protein
VGQARTYPTGMKPIWILRISTVESLTLEGEGKETSHG